MSIIVGDKQFRTLNDRLYVDGKRVLKVYPAEAHGTLVKVRGTINKIYTHTHSDQFRYVGQYQANAWVKPGLMSDGAWYNSNSWFDIQRNSCDYINLHPPAYMVKASFAAIYYAGGLNATERDPDFSTSKIISIDSAESNDLMQVYIGDQNNINKRQYIQIDPSGPGTYSLFTTHTINRLRPLFQFTNNVYYRRYGHTINDHYFLTGQSLGVKFTGDSHDYNLCASPINMVFPLCDIPYTKSLWFEDYYNTLEYRALLLSYKPGNQLIFRYEISPIPVCYGRCLAFNSFPGFGFKAAGKFIPVSNQYQGTANRNNNRLFSDKNGCFAQFYNPDTEDFEDRTGQVCAIPTSHGSLRLYVKNDPVLLPINATLKLADSITTAQLNPYYQTYAFAEIPITDIMYVGNEDLAPDWAKQVTPEDLISY